jgi:hypothetical protein
MCLLSLTSNACKYPRIGLSAEIKFVDPVLAGHGHQDRDACASPQPPRRGVAPTPPGLPSSCRCSNPRVRDHTERWDWAHNRKLAGRTAALACLGDVFNGTHFYCLLRRTARFSRPAAGSSATWGCRSCRACGFAECGGGESGTRSLVTMGCLTCIILRV